jgi:ADP-heptose:LPS heptosyltransferase
MLAPAAFIELDERARLPAEALALLHTCDARPKVGLAWRSASTARHEPYRSIGLRTLAQAIQQTGCRFYSLQVGELSDDERAIMQALGIVDLAPCLHSFGDTGRAMQQLDLVISIDSGPAHLAAALDRPVWMLLAGACDCRWYDCQRFTPWYPSMRLYRQPELGDWNRPLAELRADLQRLAASDR